MSWKNKIESGVFKITTGDGKEYRPLWKPGETSVGFNATSYNFIDLKGTLIDRKQPESTKYPFIIWFQGEDNIDQTEAFLKSAEDPRAWEVEHPFYGIINGQPLSIGRNDKNYNVTELKIDFWESISVDYPEDEISLRDRTTSKVSSITAAGVKSYSSAKPSSKNIITMKESAVQTQGSFSAGNKKVDYQRAFNKAQKAADKLITDKNTAISAQQELFSIPTLFDIPIDGKLSSYINALEKLLDFVRTKPDKNMYETQGSTAVACACESAVLEEDYTTRSEIESATDKLLKMYSTYLTNLDSFQVGQYDVENTWRIEPELQILLNDLVVDTVANLQNLAFDAKQERIVHTEKDTHTILLVHRYIGLDQKDENIDRFREVNNIKNEELFLVKKGREIKYFV